MAQADPSRLHTSASHPTLHTYSSATQTIADTLSADFWDTVSDKVAVGDYIATQMSDSPPQSYRPVLGVTGNDAGVVTVEVVTPA